MKILLTLFLLLSAVCLTARAATGTATITFTGPKQVGVEYFAEQRSGPLSAPVWTEVAKGPTSPLSVTMPDVQPGVYTFRVRARLVESPASVTVPSNETSGVVLPSQPASATVTITFATESTVTPR